MGRWIPTLIVLAIALGAGYVYHAEVLTAARQLYALALPCTMPITYSLGSIDPRFGISSSSLLAALSASEAVWESELDRELFRYTESGGQVMVHFMYDDRQATFDKLRSLGVVVTNTKASYDEAEAEYQRLRAAYEVKRQQFDAANEAFKRDVAAYEAEVKRVNARGGARGEEYARLQAQKAALDSQHASLLASEKALNAEVASLNGMVTTLNRLAARVNEGASAYNETAGGSHEEFEEAEYRSAAGEAAITVYEFDTRARLERVLAHELGHALGLDHVEGEASIMYRLNQSANQEATAEDIAELNRACRIS